MNIKGIKFRTVFIASIQVLLALLFSGQKAWAQG